MPARVATVGDVPSVPPRRVSRRHATLRRVSVRRARRGSRAVPPGGDGDQGRGRRAVQEGQDLPRDELRHESLRLERAGDRQQRRPQRRPPRTTRGPSTRRTTGATSSRPTPTSTRTTSSRPSRATTGPGRAGDLQERLRAAHAAEAQAGGPDPRMRRAARRRRFLAHWGYDNKNRTTVEPPGERERILARRPRTAASRRRSRRAASRTPSRSSSMAPRSRGRSPGNSETASSRARTRCRGSITVDEAARPAGRPRPVRPADRRQGRRRRRGSRRRRVDGHDRRRDRAAAR